MVRPMPDNGAGHHLEAMLHQMHDLVKSFGKDIRHFDESMTAKLDGIDKVLRGSNGEAGLLERERINRHDIAEIKKALELLGTPAAEREKTTRAKLRAIAEIVVAVAALTGSALGVLQLVLGG